MIPRIPPVLAVLSLCALASLAGGCASPGPTATANDQNDPYESFNRKVFAMNEKLDNYVALPVAKAYVAAIPQPARDGVHNALTNLGEPVTLANDILQGEALRAVQTLGRIAVNSSIGLGGLVDVASPMGIPDEEQDFGLTLGKYGAGEGPYLVLPFFGPSNPRDATGELVDVFFDPLTYIGMREKPLWTGGRAGLGIVDERAQNIDTLDELRKSSVDLYATLRSLYRQHRDAEIRGGKPDLQNLPNI